jgi:hypothetical protein
MSRPTSVFLALFLWISFANAASFPATARLTIGGTTPDFDELNQEMRTQGLKEFNGLPQYGVEITFPWKFLDVGIAYKKRYSSNDETNADPNTDYQAVLDQDAVLFLARYPFLKSDVFRADLFAGVGGSNTRVKIKTSGQDGEYSAAESSDWFKTPWTSAGVSFGVGYKSWYVVFEGGYESNKVESFKTSGNLNGNIKGLDFSGSYFSIGILFDGIKATK